MCNSERAESELWVNTRVCGLCIYTLVRGAFHCAAWWIYVFLKSMRCFLVYTCKVLIDDFLLTSLIDIRKKSESSALAWMFCFWVMLSHQHTKKNTYFQTALGWICKPNSQRPLKRKCIGAKKILNASRIFTILASSAALRYPRRSRRPVNCDKLQHIWCGTRARAKPKCTMYVRLVLFERVFKKNQAKSLQSRALDCTKDNHHNFLARANV